MIQEFKKFVMRGNVVDLAVGMVVGGAFGKIVSSFVTDILTPPLGILMGGVNFTDLKLILKEAIGTQAAVSINYGAFIQSAINFLIVAFAIFTVVKAMNAMKKKEKEAPAAPTAPSKQEILLEEIRDLLKK
jgi:large conductance mechanosensitive channel